MQKFLAGLLITTLFASLSASAFTLVCFTKNEPTFDPEDIVIADREIYFTKMEGNASVSIWSEGVMMSEMPCTREPGMSLTTDYKCGNELIQFDHANNLGAIRRDSDESGNYLKQSMICRDIDHLIVNTIHQKN